MAKVHISSIQDLKLDKRNVNRGTARGAHMLDRSLASYGAGRSILLDRKGQVIAGNKTLEAAKRAGYKQVVVVPSDGTTLVAVQRSDLDIDSKKARELAIADNRIAQVDLDWDPGMLASLEVDLKEFWNEDEFAELLAQSGDGVLVEAPEPKLDQAEELQKKWGTALGQIWEIGKHRLMCGDSTDPAQVAGLMNSEKAQLLATDPPYLVGYDAKNHPQNFKQNNKNKEWHGRYADKQKDEPLGPFYEGFLKCALDVCDQDAAIYVWHASQRQVEVEKAMRNCGILVHQQIVWFKNKATLTHSFYMWAHEPCFFGWQQSHKPRRNRGEFPTTVWQVDVPVLPGKESRHPTEKPLKLFTTPILLHTRKGALCYEPFSGSGTCLCAAEATGRRCYAMELEPAFAGVALERLSEMSLKPILL